MKKKIKTYNRSKGNFGVISEKDFKANKKKMKELFSAGEDYKDKKWKSD